MNGRLRYGYGDFRRELQRAAQKVVSGRFRTPLFRGSWLGSDVIDEMEVANAKMGALALRAAI